MPFQKGNKLQLGNKTWLGRKHSEETKEKIRQIRIKKKLSSKSNNPNWKGGKYKSRDRWYILNREHPLSQPNGYIPLSHSIAEKCLGRYLKPEEIIHHINENKSDDRPENLYLFASNFAHSKYHADVKFKGMKPITKSNLINLPAE